MRLHLHRWTLVDIRYEDRGESDQRFMLRCFYYNCERRDCHVTKVVPHGSERLEPLRIAGGL